MKLIVADIVVTFMPGGHVRVTGSRARGWVYTLHYRRLWSLKCLHFNILITLMPLKNIQSGSPWKKSQPKTVKVGIHLLWGNMTTIADKQNVVIITAWQLIYCLKPPVSHRHQCQALISAVSTLQCSDHTVTKCNIPIMSVTTDKPICCLLWCWCSTGSAFEASFYYTFFV